MVFLGFRCRGGATGTARAERAEDLAGIGIAVVIWASAAFAGFESIRAHPSRAHHHVAAGIAGAALGIVGNQRRLDKLRVGKRINSATLIATPASWLDALSWPVRSQAWSLLPSACPGATRWPGWR